MPEHDVKAGELNSGFPLRTHLLEPAVRGLERRYFPDNSPPKAE